MSEHPDPIEAAYQRTEARAGRSRGNQRAGKALGLAIDEIRAGLGQTDGMDSLIEMQMLRALVQNRRLSRGGEPAIIDNGKEIKGEAGTLIAPQYPLLGYRADFAVVSTITDTRCVVECDGYEYHHKPAPFEHDRLRDRRLLIAGWPVLRFSYQQIMDDVKACSEEVASYLLGGCNG